MKLNFTMYHLKNLYIFFAILALIIFFFSTTKVKANAFEVKNIEISQPFKKNFNKNEVISNGFKEAFFELINSLVKSSDLKKIDEIKLKEIKSMVDSFSIKEEKFIKQIYYVNLGVSFNKKKIFKFLEKKNIFPSQIIKETFLFIPIIIDQDLNDLVIFSNNPIYKNWNNFSKETQLINYLLPTEDLEDMNLIKSKSDFIEDYDFDEIIQKYFLKHSIIALIFKKDNEINVLSKINIQDNTFIKNNLFSKFNLYDENEIESFVIEIMTIYEDLWKEYNQINTSIKLPLLIRVDNDNLNTSLEFESILDQVDLINAYSIKKFDKNYLLYKVIFNGTTTNFINIMREKDYNFDTQKKIWILK